jgi:DNA (cytosine-5)-methyltransferase 1
MRSSEILLDEIIIDSFAGGGGTSEGIVAALGCDPDIAVNHDRFALAMHRINHPNTRHAVEDVVTVDAVSMCDGRPIGMLWMSPDCKDHSKAKGGKPRDKNIRGLAWAVFGWVKALPQWQRPRIVFLENVEEFQDWSPLLPNGKRDPAVKGIIFEQFVSSWRALGYDKIEWRERRAWRAGRKMQAATIRKRLYMIIRRDGEPIVWPDPTRGNPNDAKDAAKIASGLLTPWKTAADCINWSLPCPSIFDTSAEVKARFGIRANRPLVASTMARIAKGVSRYVLNHARPFIVPITHAGSPRAHDSAEPLRTVTTARRGELAVVSPVMVRTAHGDVGANGKKRGRGDHDVDEPLPTILGTNDVAVAAVHLATMRNSQKPFNEVDRPIHTLTAGGANISVVAAFMAQHTAGSHPGAPAKAVDEPISTITAAGSQQSVAVAHMVNLHGSDRRDAPADEPLRTLTSGGTHAGAVLGFLAKYYGAGLPSQDCGEPLHTDTAKPRFGLIEANAALPPFAPEHRERARQVAGFLRAHGYWDDREFVTVDIDGVAFVIIDIGMRMLTARERFTAQGFRPDYIIDRGVLEDGTEIRFTAEQQGYMCGNSVCPPEAEDLIAANYERRKVRRPRPRRLNEFPLLEAAE